MAEVSNGPVSTLPGKSHDLPDGTMCDSHPDRLAVARIQGETDSFGCEMYDMCQECLDEHRAYRDSPEATTGRCDWCKGEATDLRNTRDFEEGTSGPVYRVCGGCSQKQNDAIREHCDDYDDYDDYDDEDDYDPGEECGRWINGSLGQQCTQAGTEFCDWDCPHRNRRF